MLKTPLKTLLDILINHFTKERLVTLITGHDEKLLTFMLEHENANDHKKHFFKTIANSLVFNEKALLECLEKYLEIRKLDRSFTRFKNKIGLFSQEGFIKSSGSVVLHFPFKDNVLLGNAKDNSTKSNELFYHEILHKNEIDTLLHPKALCNFEMHGQGDLESALKDENTNYLIKGNNLIALHSLKKKFAKKVKCIYIDPPYNTGNDSFNYNDNFNHSSWLVFMKNRLEAAREFLSDDGVIFVQCDDNEQAYLKVLMDEIFGRENFVNCIVCEMSNESGNKIQHAIQGKKFPKVKEYILVYAKNKENICLIIPKVQKRKWDKEYNIIIPTLSEDISNTIDTLIASNNEKELNEILSCHKLMSLSQYLQNNNINEQDEWKFENSYRIFASKPNTALRDKAITLHFNSQIYALKNSHENIKIIRTDFNRNTDTARIELVSAKNNQSVFLSDIWKKIVTTGGVAQEGGVILKNGKKPEHLLEIILRSATNENDLVLDFFAGSGTTCAVAHKMKRRYIGIEQMDYIETITKERLKKVIEGEQGGISKKCDFKGGGSFVYAELKKVNSEIKKQILNAKSADECLKIFNALNARVLKRADDKIDEIHSEEFQKLDLNEQKRKCCASLDSNEDYLNLGDIDEDAWEIDGITKKYNEIFYS
ncbi:site-specific DNA-methyltransferase [Helicobacter pylori]|uniref:site-specific DNA-methyltransferase n=1 Tax=Helicobacter pylori TaxID=210 RepID=UPI0001E37F58|nr:site-specific DNA-methyltransferase [Helicobacter pylori]ADN80504.1 type III restriction-modification system methylation subunit [Helicobacter pylori 908]ADZ50457.1 Type III restriction-modification system methylation subunit [Helicobacter pylori 2017]ADZ52064.1 Type III restriction-modification system methylation subunit [Helicobacter pylori 2018]